MRKGKGLTATTDTKNVNVQQYIPVNLELYFGTEIGN